MASNMIEAGSVGLDPVLRAAQTVIDNKPVSVESLPHEKAHDLEYERRPLDFVEIENELTTGAATSVRFISSSPDLKWVIIFAPEFDGSGPPWWMLVVDLGTANYEKMFSQLSEDQDILHVIASMEDTLDIDKTSYSPEKFPWDDPKLLRATFRPSGRNSTNRVDKLGPASR